MAYVKKNDKYGFIDNQGNTIINFIYDDALGFNDGLSPVKLGKKWGMINKQGVVVLDFKYKSIYYRGCQTFVIEKKEKYGFIDNFGNRLTEIIYNSSTLFYEDNGLISVCLSGTGVLDSHGNVVIECIYDDTWICEKVIIVKDMV